jgi:division protein CdvB (Snf7/Vps24/ESCRT-III family)
MDSFKLGLEKILNNPKTSFLTNPATFHEIHKTSGMPMSAMIKQIGKMEQNVRGKKKEKSDDERSKERLDELQSKSEK